MSFEAIVDTGLQTSNIHNSSSWAKSFYIRKIGKQYGRTGKSLGNPLKCLKNLGSGRNQKIGCHVTWNTLFILGLTLLLHCIYQYVNFFCMKALRQLPLATSHRWRFGTPWLVSLSTEKHQFCEKLGRVGGFYFLDSFKLLIPWNCQNY